MSIISKFELNFDHPVAIDLHNQFQVLGVTCEDKPYIFIKTEDILGPRRVHEFYVIETNVEFPRQDTPHATFTFADADWHVIQSRKAGTAQIINKPVEGAQEEAEKTPIDPLEALKNKAK